MWLLFPVVWRSNHSNQLRALHYSSALLFIHPVALNLGVFFFFVASECTNPLVRRREREIMKTIITKLRFRARSLSLLIVCLAFLSWTWGRSSTFLNFFACPLVESSLSPPQNNPCWYYHWPHCDQINNTIFFYPILLAVSAPFNANFHPCFWKPFLSFVSGCNSHLFPSVNASPMSPSINVFLLPSC